MKHSKFSAGQFRLMYVTQGKSEAETRSEIETVLAGGCKWVQIRMKDAPLSAIENMARWALPLCIDRQAVLVVNDHPSVASFVGAHGVHIGMDDVGVELARKILGDDKIIGATANTFNDVKRLVELGVDYLGIGPFRFTSTKQKLGPLLGLDGYAGLSAEMARGGLVCPWVAIGGIGLEDVGSLRDSGVMAIAVSGAIANSERPIDQTRLFVDAVAKMAAPLESY